MTTWPLAPDGSASTPRWSPTVVPATSTAAVAGQVDRGGAARVGVGDLDRRGATGRRRRGWRARRAPRGGGRGGIVLRTSLGGGARRSAPASRRPSTGGSVPGRAAAPRPGRRGARPLPSSGRPSPAPHTCHATSFQIRPSTSRSTDERPPPLACVAAVGALLALSACEKPAPIVTVVSGGESVYDRGAHVVLRGPDPARERAPSAPPVRTEGRRPGPAVRAGETVGVDVDKELAERGWYLELRGPAPRASSSRSAREPQEGHYFSFTAPSLDSAQSPRHHRRGAAARRAAEDARPTGSGSSGSSPG